MSSKHSQEERDNWARQKRNQRARQGSESQGPSEEDREAAQHQRDFGF